MSDKKTLFKSIVTEDEDHTFVELMCSPMEPGTFVRVLAKVCATSITEVVQKVCEENKGVNPSMIESGMVGALCALILDAFSVPEQTSTTAKDLLKDTQTMMPYGNRGKVTIQ